MRHQQGAGCGMAYDVIGDIHGQGGKLESMLRKLGYVQKAGSWKPPQGREAVFLGDLIDRGPEQVKVVDTVRRMVDAGYAKCIMGNHEFNAIGFMMEDPKQSGAHLRCHSQKNIDQHKEFLAQVGQGSQLHLEMIQWFRHLPPMLDLGGIRVVHAWWYQPYVDLISNKIISGAPMTDQFVADAYSRGSLEYQAMEGLTKGLEVSLPAGITFTDHGGVMRSEVRTKWWHEDAKTYRDVAILPEDQSQGLPEHPLPENYLGEAVQGSPVFVGHYWMSGSPQLQTNKLACVDYSAAKDGPLVCYRWDGEENLNEKSFVEAS
jgi:Calcineurin-like phosphoesterase